MPINTWDINGSDDGEPACAGLIVAAQVQIIHCDNDAQRAMANLQPTSADPVRVPPFKARQLEFVIMGNVNVRSLHFATTIEELKAS